MTKLTIFILALFAACLASTTFAERLESYDLDSDSQDDVDDNLYEIKPSKQDEKPKFLVNNEHELAGRKEDERHVIGKRQDKELPREVQQDQESSLKDKLRAIAFNSREVRLVGPNQKEVEMKDDVATKMVIALENLQKDVEDVWGEVNEKLDKGWNEFKSLVEGVISPASTATKKSKYI